MKKHETYAKLPQWTISMIEGYKKEEDSPPSNVKNCIELGNKYGLDSATYKSYLPCNVDSITVRWKEPLVVEMKNLTSEEKRMLSKRGQFGNVIGVAYTPSTVRLAEYTEEERDKIKKNPRAEEQIWLNKIPAAEKETTYKNIEDLKTFHQMYSVTNIIKQDCDESQTVVGGKYLTQGQVLHITGDTFYSPTKEAIVNTSSESVTSAQIAAGQGTYGLANVNREGKNVVFDAKAQGLRNAYEEGKPNEASREGYRRFIKEMYLQSNTKRGSHQSSWTVLHGNF